MMKSLMKGGVDMFQVLIVDDEASVRTYAELFLDWPSIDCEIAGTAANGQEIGRAHV